MTNSGFVRLLHITDLHARAAAWPVDIDEKKQLTGRAIGDTRDASFRAMLKRMGKEETWPKAILVTGDVVNRGGADKGEFERAREFLHALRADLNIDAKRVFVVPGNHDVTWDPKLGLADTEKFRAFMEAMSDFCLPQFQGGTLMPRTTADLSNIAEGISIELTLLVTPTYSGIADPLGEKLIKHLAGKLPDFSEAQMKELEQTVMEAHRTLDVAALGTAQRQYLAELPAPSSEVVRIALMHHHLLPHPQIEVTTFEAVVDAGQTLQTLIDERFDLVVHGHKHLPHLAKYTNRSRRGVHVYAGPSLFEDSTGFAFIDVYGPRGAHDIKLTQFAVDYRTRQITQQFTREIDRDGRVLDPVLTLASEVPLDVQENVVQPLLENLTRVLAWRDEYADKELFNCIWEQVSREVSDIGRRRVTFRPDKVDDQLSRLVQRINDEGQAGIRMVSNDDLDYWIGAKKRNTRSHEYRTVLKNFAGTKARILIVNDRDVERDEEYRKKLRDVVDDMIDDGFEVAVVRDHNLPNVPMDFGIYGQTAVGLFDQLEGSSRQLTLIFNREDLTTYERAWGLLHAAYAVQVKEKGAIDEWLSSL